MMNASRVLHFLLPLAIACEPTAPAPATPDASPAPTSDTSAPVPPSSDGVLVRGDGISVTIADFDAHVARGVLFSSDATLKKGLDALKPDRLKVPSAQINITRALIGQALVFKYARARGLEATPDEIRARIASDPRLSRFQGGRVTLADGQPAPWTLADLGLTQLDLDTVAASLVLRDELTAALLAEVSVDDARKSFVRMQRRVDLLVAAFDNTPDSKTLDTFVANPDNQARIAEYLKKNVRRFRAPHMIEVTMLKAQGDPDRAKLDAAKAALERGEDPAEVANAQGLKLQAKETMVRQEDPKAFRAEPGTVGISLKRPRGSYVWKVTARKVPKDPVLDRPLSREIAAEILRTQTIVPSAQARFGEVAAAMRALPAKSAPDKALADLRQAIPNKRVRLSHTKPFIDTPNGFIPGVGLAPPVVKAAFVAKAGEVSKAPLRHEQTVYAFRVLAQQNPDLKDFEARSAKILADYRKAQTPYILEQWLNRWREKDQVIMDLRPLRAKYGVLKKPK